MHGTGERGEIRSQEGGEVEQLWPPRKFSRRMDHASRLRIRDNAHKILPNIVIANISYTWIRFSR